MFPVSGRIHRRSRDAATDPAAQKKAELARRLRRLEAMVTNLGSQVEDVAEVGASMQDSPAVDAAQGSLGTAERTLEFSQLSGEPRDLSVNEDGEIVVGDGFWSLFFKEERIGSLLISLLG